MPLRRNRLVDLIAVLRGRPASPKSRRAIRRGLAFEGLEGRAVPSSLSFGFGGGQAASFQQGRGGGQQGTGGSLGASPNVGGVCGGGGGGATTSSALTQDARTVQQAFQTFDAAYLSAVTALRATATTTTPPTPAGIAAFDQAIATAINTLDASIGKRLGNLTNTGTAVANTIDGYTATLQTEIDSAATGLANSTNAAVLAMNQEVNADLKSAEGQASAAILADTPVDTVTTSTIQTYKQAVQTAFQAFNSAISNAEQTSISGGTALSTSAVSSAVSTLQTALTSAVSVLGSQFTASTFNPAAAISADLTNLTTALDAITGPTAGNTPSSRVFLRTVGSTLSQYEMMVSQSIATAIQGYNNSLL
jgi:hypothetical protein